MDTPALTDEQAAEVEQATAELRAICRTSAVPDDERPELAAQLHSLQLVADLTSVELIDAYCLLSERSKHAPAHPLYLLYIGSGKVERASHHGQIEPPRDVNVYHLVTAPMGIDCGHVYIRPERARDVIADWFRHVDVDFEEAPEFSDNYYVQAESPERFRAGIDLEILRAVGHLDDLHVELKGSTLAATTPGALHIGHVSRLVGLALDVAARASHLA